MRLGMGVCWIWRLILRVEEGEKKRRGVKICRYSDREWKGIINQTLCH